MPRMRCGRQRWRRAARRSPVGSTSSTPRRLTSTVAPERPTISWMPLASKPRPRRRTSRKGRTTWRARRRRRPRRRTSVNRKAQELEASGKKAAVGLDTFRRVR
eukprot:6670499-Prymnesium_polylepis.1